jgi:hypothetical protein
MAISFLKSIITKFRTNRANSCQDGNQALSAKCFSTDQKQEEAFDAIDRGCSTVPVNQIVGSVGRYQDFDNQFRIKSHLPAERFLNIKAAMRVGKVIPPVKLYQIKDEYYVLDGNHRVAAAKELGHDEIRADILEFMPSKNTFDNILYRERAEFKALTGLTDSIKLTEVGQYIHLQDQISQHQRHLEQQHKDGVTYKDAAKDWYLTIYLPLTKIVTKGGLLERFPQRSVADLYAYISFHQWDINRARQYGIDIDELITRDMEAFRKKMETIPEKDYPEMLRGITAFVLMKVDARKERRIMEKMFAHKEVREIHAVHGDVDIIVKIVLTRDLLSSDAEVIAQFVHENIRTIAGVSSTQTLIPGRSKVKDQLKK